MNKKENFLILCTEGMINTDKYVNSKWDNKLLKGTGLKSIQIANNFTVRDWQSILSRCTRNESGYSCLLRDLVAPVATSFVCFGNKKKKGFKFSHKKKQTK